MAPVAALLAMDRTTLTAALKPLARRGLVEILNDPSDGRSRRLKITEQGRALLAQAVPIWQRASRELEANLHDGDAGRLRANLLVLC